MDREFGINQALVEELFLRYQENRFSVEEHWRKYFDRIAEDNGTATAPKETAPASTPGNGHNFASVAPSIAPPRPSANEMLEAAAVQGRVYSLINAYRSRGHLFAELDPLGMMAKPPTELSLETFGLSAAELDTPFPTGDLAGPEVATLREIVGRCEETYCRSIGVEYVHLEKREERLWLQQRMELTCNRLALSPARQRRILEKLTEAESFEQFIHLNYKGAKRFSCEGTESMIPLMDLLIEEAAKLGVEEIVIGMAHRGRLNVLANIMHKPVRDIFAGFEDKHPEKNIGRGDVKYHLGYSKDIETEAGTNMHLSLTFNPSHLEFVGAVVEGRVRAKQDRQGDTERRKVMPLVLHGDAAFMGQGIVAETLNMGGLEGYHTGGTIHVVINNQVGFTTNTEDSRSTRYATDITRMLKMPVFHVNGEDPEAVAQVTVLAVEYRQRFGKDVCIDLYGYRKYGHNEGDEPRVTQPLMYKVIDQKPTVRQVYVKRLAELGTITPGEAEKIGTAVRDRLEADLALTKNTDHAPTISAFAGFWNKFRAGSDADTPDVETALPVETLQRLFETMYTLPPNVNARRQVMEAFQKRLTSVRERTRTLDWGAGEALAFASLLSEGTRIRLSGQDARRGTFSHRHAVITDQESGKRFCPLNSVATGRATFEVYDSPLSEAGVMGFDYGYSLDYPDGLVLWEAQFGDFANGAQVIIDQFLSAAEDKWNRHSGLVLLLPHGFEGAGPEHSSARLERFLQLCAEDNMYVCSLTSSAQLFHLFRRQVHRSFRKPLVLMTPKSLLRQCFSSIEEFATNGFKRVLPDTGAIVTKEKTITIDPTQVDRVLLCSGKIYFELEVERAKRQASNIAIVRLEQLYPLSERELLAALAPYKPGTEIVWVQEEPWNMGAWYFLSARAPAILKGRHPLRCAARAESASPATGSPKSHEMEQRMLLDEAFAK